MPNNVVPMPQHGSPPPGWTWDGQNWVCHEHHPQQIPPWGPWGPPFFGPQQPPWYPGANGGVTFSMEEPKHVIRGHFWWNGTVLAMFDGAAWVQIGPGV